jgi:hypothetical protein
MVLMFLHIFQQTRSLDSNYSNVYNIKNQDFDLVKLASIFIHKFKINIIQTSLSDKV